MRLLFATLVVTAPLFAQTCDYAVLPAALTIPSSASSGRIAVNTQFNCSWTVSNPTLAWLTFDSIQGTGSGAVTYTAEANPFAIDRTGSITVAGKQISVTQGATACSYLLDPKSQNMPVQGGAGSFKLTTGCIWQPVSSNGNMVSVTDSGNVRVGNGTVNFTVAPNSCVYGRSASIFINTSNSVTPAFPVTQDGSPSNLTLSPASVTAGPDASDGRLSVITGAGCSWSAFSDVTWMQLISGGGGAGNGAIAYHLLANTTAPRTGTIHVGNASYTVTQNASGPAVPFIGSIGSAANYRNDAVAPGEIVTVFGTGMGPDNIVTLQVTGGNVASSLAGTQVLFDGIPAPMIYTLGPQVSAIVPYAVAGKDATKVQVVYNGLTSSTVTVPVQSAHPAIFTLDKTGLGPGAILNQDNTVNSSANPAARGSFVAIFATGGGVTRPALADGAITGTDLPLLTTQPVTVTIGGIDVAAAYAGGAPAAVAGLTQINAQIPAGVTPGIVPVVIKVGTFNSSPGVTLSVR